MGRCWGIAQIEELNEKIDRNHTDMLVGRCEKSGACVMVLVSSGFIVIT
jgi:hypothetical protein